MMVLSCCGPVSYPCPQRAAWAVAGLGAGSDYDSTVLGEQALSGAGNLWKDFAVTSAAQSWVQNAAANYGVVLLEKSSSGSVYASLCSELGWCNWLV